MYLRHLYIENNGPLRKLDLELQFSTDDSPKPVVLVGSNGSGKTNLLSIIADALFEAASVHYNDIVPDMAVGNRPWFRIIGPTTVSAGASGDCAILQFEHDDKSYFYKEKGGKLLASDVTPHLPEVMRPIASWEEEGPIKTFSIGDEQSRLVFEEGAYAYFPSSRAEIPHWLNRNSVQTEEFNLDPKIQKMLRKPIYVEEGLQRLKQWLLSMLIDIRMDFQLIPTGDESRVPIAVGDVETALAHKSVWDSMNLILREIVDDTSARFVWFGRNRSSRIGFECTHNGIVRALPLDSLSAGQATLLSIFGTLLRYGDGTTKRTATTAEQISGICLIDEIDAHMHVHLQHATLPKLMKMFPKVQFIVSTHSPLFVLGIEKAFGRDEISIIDMPTGTHIQAELYAEFGRAFEVMQDTKAFNKAILEATGTTGKLIVFLEGESDPIYMKCAAELLGRAALLDRVEFEWIGAKDPGNIRGQTTVSPSMR